MDASSRCQPARMPLVNVVKPASAAAAAAAAAERLRSVRTDALNDASRMMPAARPDA